MPRTHTLCLLHSRLVALVAAALLVIPLVAAPPAGAVSIDLSTDFGDASSPIRYEQGRVKGSIHGVVPSGWADDSSWADVDVAYEPRESEGRRFLRLDITRVETGQVQMAQRLPELTEAVTCELSVTLRNQSGGPVQIGVRRRSAPYTFLWRSPPLADAEWTTRQFRFALPATADPIGLYLTTKGIGYVDIAEVRLRALDRETYRRNIRAEHPDGGPANLVRVTRFPAGMPTGWSMDRSVSDGDEAVVTSDPTGALLIDSDRAVSVTGAPFRVASPIDEHRAVARVSGTGDWHLDVYNGKRRVATTPLRLDPSQSRDVGVSFETDLFDTDCQLRFRGEGPGTLRIAWVKAGPATKVDAFDPAAEPAIDVRLIDADAQAAGVQFADEDAAVVVRTLDAPPGATLQVVLTHGMGESETITMPASATTRLTALNDPSRPLGAYRVEAWLELEGERITPIAERVVYRLRRPRFWGVDGEASALGVHTISTARHNTMAKAIGINWVRTHDAGLDYVGWHFVEPEPGRWVFRDDAIDRYRDHDLMIFGQLGTAPKWASYYPPEKADRRFDYWNKYFQPRDLADYAQYVRVITERYRDRIKHWDIWNEPWIHAWWAVDFDPSIGGRAGFLTSEQPQRDYVRLKQTAFETAKSVDPAIRIAGFNTTTNNNPGRTRFTGPEWTRGVYEAGGLDYSDVMTYHQYASGSLGHPGDAVATGLQNAFGELFEAEGRGVRPIWMTEGQPNIGRSGTGLYKHTPTGAAADAYLASGDRMVRYLTSLRAHGVERVFLYSMHAHSGLFSDDGHWRVLTQPDGTLHPVGAALSAFAYHVDGLPFVERVELAPGVDAFVFGDAERTASVVLANPQHDAWLTPEGAEDLWGNPIAEGTPIGTTAVFLAGRAGEPATD